MITNDGTLRMFINHSAGTRIRRFLSQGISIKKIIPDAYNFCAAVPEAFPFVEEGVMRELAGFLYCSDSLLANKREPWDIAAKALLDGTFLHKDLFLQLIADPLLLRIRRFLASYGVDVDTEPSHETDVRIRRPDDIPPTEIFAEAYPDMKTLEFEQDTFYHLLYRNYGLIPYMTAAEIGKMARSANKKGFLGNATVERFARKMMDGTFAAPEAFVKNIYTGCACSGRIKLIRTAPELAHLMTKSDFPQLLDVKGVLAYGLEKGWVTKFNHDEIFSALTEDEDRALLLSWDEQHGMQAQMEKLEETRRNADAFSTGSMRKDWLVSHCDGGVCLTLRPTLSSDTVCIPAEVSGRPILEISAIPAKSAEGGGVPRSEVRRVLLDSRFGERFSFLSGELMFKDEIRKGIMKVIMVLGSTQEPVAVETFGAGPLKAVPGALLNGNSIVMAVPGRELVLPEGVTEIPRGVFTGASYDKISLPSSLTSIGDRAFKGCGGFSEIDIPCCVGDSAFAECYGLKKVRVNGDIAAHAFWNCKSLSEVEFGPGVRRIGDFAFDLYQGSSYADRLASVRVFRARVSVSAFFGRTLESAVFVGCEFATEHDSGYMYSELVAESLTLSRCSGHIVKAKPKTSGGGQLTIDGGSVTGDFKAYAEKEIAG